MTPKKSTDIPPKVMPKNKLVRIKLPPRPTAAPLIRIPILSLPSPPEIVLDEFPKLLHGYVSVNEEDLRKQYGVDYIAFAYERDQRIRIREIASHEIKVRLRRLIRERYVPYHPDAEICINTIDGILYPDASSRGEKA
jgi:hypothetical protein